MTFNIQHGIDGAHKYNLQRAIDTIAKLQPDLVGLQEVTRTTRTTTATISRRGSRRAEGGDRPSVVRVNRQEWFTPNVECQQNGKGDGKETEGLAFVSPHPIGEPSTDETTGEPDCETVRPRRRRDADHRHHLANGKRTGRRVRTRSRALKWTETLGPAQMVSEFQPQAGRGGTTADVRAVSRRVEERRESVCLRRERRTARAGSIYLS